MEREQIEREEEIKELSLKMRRKYVFASLNISVMCLSLYYFYYIQLFQTKNVCNVTEISVFVKT